MTQARSGQAFSLNLTPMQVPEALPELEKGDALATRRADGAIALPSRPAQSLQLNPGEPGELIAQIRNLSPYLMQVRLHVEGDFPLEWCRIGTEGQEILPHQTMDAVLYFQIPDQFFEINRPVTAQNPLTLDYQGRLYVASIEPETGRRQVDYTPFRLVLRSRSLYLDFLPDIYREVDFIGRFLKIFEETFEPAVHTLDNLWAYLDPLTAPQTLLPFLAHWVAWQPSPYLSLERQRHLIRSAIQIYGWRGTRRGLRFFLHLATGLPLDEQVSDESQKHISILESFNQGFILGETSLGEDAILGDGDPYHFSVRLRSPNPAQVDETLVRRVIEQEKPAFCSYDLFIESES